ncbi:hypothetical protein [Bacillus niameyensis]|uniref:hypothetical protein n=1 Tax=Bacillus niameyensis TaxID=1522308 RepID=UPI0007804C93|nr:hypothetical protein [Bacillus niameyensis]
MDEMFGYAFVFLLISGFSYGLIKQIQYTIHLRKVASNDKRRLYGNYLYCFSFAGFLIYFTLNVTAIIPSTVVTSESTGLACFIFLIILIIAKYKIIPKSLEPTILLK